MKVIQFILIFTLFSCHELVEAMAINLKADLFSSCQIKDSTITVSLGDWLTRDFTKRGSTSEKKSATWSLDCADGAKVKVIIRAKTDPSFANVIVLDNTGEKTVATGLGVQLFDENNQLLNLNKAFSLSEITQGINAFKWQAAYIQTDNTVSAGTANASVTLDITYQ